MRVTWLVVMCLAGAAASPLKVLGIFPYQGHSHHAVLQGVVRALLARGHQVTSLSPMEHKTTNPNHTHITTPMPQLGWSEIFQFEDQVKKSQRALISDLNHMSEALMHAMWTSEELKGVLSSGTKWDVVLSEPCFYVEEVVLLGARLGAAVVSVLTSPAMPVQEQYSGTSINPAVASRWTVLAAGRLSFWQRLSNTVSWVVEMLEHKFSYLPVKEERWVRLMGDRPGELPLSDALYNIDLHLVNSGPCLQKPGPFLYNTVHAPGLHIVEKNPVLPPEFKKLMDSSDGVVVFSMGSMVPVSKMKPQLRKEFMSAFSRLPYLVIWKADIELPDLPPNVKIFKWLPQNAIIAHPNCKLLMTHGGLLSKQEALYHGVPTVTIPLFGDQNMNAAHSESEGFGVVLPYFSLNQNSIHAAIMSVANNDSFRSSVRRCQGVMKEMTHRSEAEVGFWVEHVAKYGGKHLRPERYLYWFQYYLLDVILLLLAGLVLAGILLVKIGHIMINTCFPQQSVRKKNKVKNN